MQMLIDATLDACRAADQYHPQRTRNSIFNHMMSEIGELGIEVNIVEGQSYKQPGSDGVIGEAIDIMLSAIDFIYVGEPGVQSQDIVYPSIDPDYDDPNDTLDSLFCHLCGRAGVVGGRINQLSWADQRGERVNQDARAVVYAALSIIKFTQPGITEAEMMIIAMPKLEKWIKWIKKQAAK
jgi:hypothetical protein